MPNTQSFVVRSKDKKIKPMEGNEFDYFRGKKKDTIDMIIEVFGYDHERRAKELYAALVKAGLQNDYFIIKIETRD